MIIHNNLKIAFETGDFTGITDPEILASVKRILGAGTKTAHIGEELDHGWIVAGVSDDTGRPFSVRAGNQADGSRQVFNHAKALEEISILQTTGAPFARLPTAKEITTIHQNLLFNNQGNQLRFNIHADNDNPAFSANLKGEFQTHSSKRGNVDVTDLVTGQTSSVSKRHKVPKCFVRDELNLSITPKPVAPLQTPGADPFSQVFGGGKKGPLGEIFGGEPE